MTIDAPAPLPLRAEISGVLAAIVRDAVMDARNAGETIYAASDEAAFRILARFPELADPDDEGLRTRLENLLAKWRIDRSKYPEQSFGAPWAATAVKLCEDELRRELEST